MFEKAVVGDMAGKRGWYIDLVEPPNPPGTKLGERMIGTPVLRSNTVLVALSVTPSLDICDVGGSSFINAIDPFTGGNVTSGFFDADGNGTFEDQITVGGQSYYVGSLGLDVGIATGLIFNANQYTVSGSANAEDDVRRRSGDTAGNTRLGRVSWREILNN